MTICYNVLVNKNKAHTNRKGGNGMLTVKLNNGNESNNEDRTFYINDVQDLKRVMDNILDDFQRCVENEMSEDRIALERLVDAAGVTDVNELEDWIKDAYEVMDALRSSDFDSVDEMTERIESLSTAIDDAYDYIDSARDALNYVR